MTASRRDCRITRVETHLVGTRWCNWVFARVFTDDGITGVGEGTCDVTRLALHRQAAGTPAEAPTAAKELP